MKIKHLALFSLALPAIFTAQTSLGAVLTTTSFDSPTTIASSNGDDGIGVNGAGAFYRFNDIGAGTLTVTPEAIDQWVKSRDNKLAYSSGVYSGTVTSNGNRRGTIQFMDDSMATTGLVNISLDVTIESGSSDKVWVELFGFNTGGGTDTPEYSWGGPGGGASWNLTNDGTATALLGSSGQGVELTTSGTHAVATNLDLGTGYNFYAWRVGMSAQASHTGTTFSNLTVTAVPEPSTAALLGLGGLALILRRKK